MDLSLPIHVPRDKVVEFCTRHHIKKLSFFGSILTPRFRPDSDVDVLVEFETEQGPGFFELSSMEMELSNVLGRQIDLRTPKELSRYFRDQVLADASVQYDRG